MVREFIEEYISLSKRANQCNRTTASQVALVVKNPSANAGDVRGMGSIYRLGRSIKGGHGNLLQILAWRIPMDRGAWWATVHGITQSRT